VIAQLMGPNSEVAQQLVRTTQEAARAKDIQLVVLNATTETEIDAAFEQLHADALLVQATPFLASRRDQLVALAARYAVPAIYFDRRFVVGGGLISYGADTDALFRQAGIYAGKILKGANPADLPVQQPTTFKLVVNLKTAKTIGLTIPPSIRARADEVIE
jgi:putative tryptophan/tyrosine transport system substrate-binding protein